MIDKEEALDSIFFFIPSRLIRLKINWAHQTDGGLTKKENQPQN